MKIGIVGCAGRMGRMVVSEVLAGAGCTLAGGTERPGSAALGSDVAALAGGSRRGSRSATTQRPFSPDRTP